MKYHLITFGCQANERDSETMAGLLQDLGYEHTEHQDEADIILFNTCCVREKAENKVLSHVGTLKTLKEKKPSLIIGIAGCMVQQKNMPERIRKTAPHVDLIFGTHNIEELPQLIAEIHRLKAPQVHVLKDREDIIERLPSHRQTAFKSLIHITYGCNNYCTYCIVPYVRGREKSRQPHNILHEINTAVAAGALEITLLGQNVNSYGRDLVSPFSFAQLLQDIDKVPQLKRVRFMTSHPKDLTTPLIEVMTQSSKICPHLHLPVQAGSNNVLQRMNRGYTREAYLALTRQIRQALPHASLTSDIIVGFPGETEADFQDTLSLIEEIRFDVAYTFMYSTRSGTPAATMKNQIPLSVKKERLQRLMMMQNTISLDINKSLKDEIVEVLVDGPSKTSSQVLIGKTTTNKTVLFPGPPELRGTLAQVKITEPQTWVLKGTLV